MANTALNRTTVALLTNKSGGALTYGDVVIIDTANASAFTTTTTGAYNATGVGVIIEPNGIANNATGLVATGGWVPKVNLNAAATVGQFIKTHTVAGQGTPHSTQAAGDFGYALTASATPPAILFGGPNLTATGATVADADYGDITVSASGATWNIDAGVVGATELATNVKEGTITVVIDGGGSAITTGIKGDIEVPIGITLQRATLLADQSGSIVIDIWKDTYANYPPTDADSITAAAPPTLSTATKSQDSTLTGWTTSVSAGDILRFNVDSITTCTRVVLSLKYVRT